VVDVPRGAAGPRGGRFDGLRGVARPWRKLRSATASGCCGSSMAR
jgi:hypothetical protein